jgi:hypothetical protein
VEVPTSRTRTVVIAVVTAVWALNFAAGLVPPLHYKPDQAINGIFMTIVGGIFAYGAVKDRANPPAPSPPPKPRCDYPGCKLDAGHDNGHLVDGPPPVRLDPPRPRAVPDPPEGPHSDESEARSS